jgi:uncharacterized protein (TIGR03067 family)
MTRFTLCLAAVVLALAAVRAEERAPAGDKGKPGPGALVGAYTIVSGEHEGKKEPPERIKGTTVLITRDTITVTDRTKKKAYVASYKLDTGSTPWKITMTSMEAPTKGEVARGLIAKEGDTVKLIYALPGGAQPKDFKTKDKQMLFVMRPLKRKG